MASDSEQHAHLNPIVSILREGVKPQGHACAECCDATSEMRRPSGEWLHGKHDAPLHGNKSAGH